MNPDAKILETMIRYCDNIAEAIQLFGNDIEDLCENIHYQNDCAFILVQIGEIVKRLSPELRNRYPKTEWSDIAKLRDRITHKYHSIEFQILWEIITDDVPLLKKDCESILVDMRY